MSKKTVTCPETGKVLQVEGNQVKKHIQAVWGVDVDKDWSIDNPTAEERIRELLKAVGGGE